MLAERLGSSQLAEMSAQGASLECSLRPRDLPRLAALVVAGQGDALQVRVGVFAGPESCPQLRIEARGSLHLACQRCLAPVAWPVDVDVTLTAVVSERQADELADPFDTVLLEEDGGLALRVAVEDEILAALPLAPRHEDAAACKAAGAIEAAPEDCAEPMSRPFAGLATLMGRRGGADDEK
jgi:uncharacterized protein